jgi:hypothetical protein
MAPRTGARQRNRRGRFTLGLAAGGRPGALRSVSQVTDAVKAFEDAGFNELYFDPTVAKLDQIDRLADAVL